MTIDKNDPRLIDYALGELDERERAAFEEVLAQDKTAWDAVNEIFAVSQCASGALQSRTELSLTESQRAEVVESAQEARPRTELKRHHLAGLIAAAAAVLVMTGFVVPGLTRIQEAAVETGNYASNEAFYSFRPAPATSPAEELAQRQLGQAETRSSDSLSGIGGGMAGGRLKSSDSNAQSLGYLDGAETPRGQEPESLFEGFNDPARLQQAGPAGRGATQLGFGGGAGSFGVNGISLGRTFQTAAAPEQNVWRYNDIPNVRQQSAPSNTEAYDRVVDNPFLTVLDNPLSTFSIDVDTASYANIRRFLNQGQLPPKDAVRIEEMINYFDYAYEPPTGEHPFAVHVEVAACPWQPGHQLARIGLQGRVLDEGERPPANLVFLIDVSGSMNQPNKLPLVVESMKLLVDQMRPDDTIALAVYAGSSGLVLPPSNGSFKDAIRNALNNLRAGGSTNGGEGIQLAYRTAKQAFKDGGVNRVILATDGDFNVGVTDRGALTRMVEQNAKEGVFLSLLGYGMGNLKDATMEELSNKGNGNYAYIDTLNEARKVLVEQAAGTLVTIAKDVKIQVDFNPAQVQAYRLIGYENRMLAAEDFQDDTKDAGEIGAGHRVTALYELVPAGAPFTEARNVTDSVYRQPAALSNVAESNELMQVRLRYKQPEGDTSVPLVVPVPTSDRTFEAASPDFQFASAVAAFGMLLRDSPYKGSANYSAVLTTAQSNLGADPHGYRWGFVQLVRSANAMRSHEAQAAEQQLRNAERAYQEALENMQRMQQQR